MLFHLGQRGVALAQLAPLRDELRRGRRTPLIATLVAHLLLAGQTAMHGPRAAEVVIYARADRSAAALAWTVEALGAAAGAEEGDLRGPRASRVMRGRCIPRSPPVPGPAGRFISVWTDCSPPPSRPANGQRLAQEGMAWGEAEAADAAWAACG